MLIWVWLWSAVRCSFALKWIISVACFEINNFLRCCCCTLLEIIQSPRRRWGFFFKSHCCEQLAVWSVILFSFLPFMLVLVPVYSRWHIRIWLAGTTHRGSNFIFVKKAPCFSKWHQHRGKNGWWRLSGHRLSRCRIRRGPPFPVEAVVGLAFSPMCRLCLWAFPGKRECQLSWAYLAAGRWSYCSAF